MYYLEIDVYTTNQIQNEDKIKPIVLLEEDRVAALSEDNKIKIWNYVNGGLLKIIQETEDVNSIIKLIPPYLATICKSKYMELQNRQKIKFYIFFRK